MLSIDVPEAPAAPTTSEVAATSCDVSWTAPSGDGGSPVIGYFIERQSNVSPRWIRVNKAPCEGVSLPVTDLVEGTEYIFRIIAVNKKGESKPSLPSDNVLAKDPFGMLMLMVEIYYIHVIVFFLCPHPACSISKYWKNIGFLLNRPSSKISLSLISLFACLLKV